MSQGVTGEADSSDSLNHLKADRASGPQKPRSIVPVYLCSQVPVKPYESLIDNPLIEGVKVSELRSTRSGLVNDVYIRRHWKDWKVGSVDLERLDGLHWGQISGGVQRVSPRPYIYGYVTCTEIEGEIAHSGVHGPCPHSIKVCVVPSDNGKEIWKKLIEIAGPEPACLRYKAVSHAELIVQALVTGSVHQAIITKGDLFIINPRKMPAIAEVCNQTASARSKRLKFLIMKRMESHQEFEQTRYRNMLAYKRRALET